MDSKDDEGLSVRSIETLEMATKICDFVKSLASEELDTGVVLGALMTSYISLCFAMDMSEQEFSENLRKTLLAYKKR